MPIDVQGLAESKNDVKVKTDAKQDRKVENCKTYWGLRAFSLSAYSVWNSLLYNCIRQTYKHL